LQTLWYLQRVGQAGLNVAVGPVLWRKCGGLSSDISSKANGICPLLRESDF